MTATTNATNDVTQEQISLIQSDQYLQLQQLLTKQVRETKIAKLILEMSTKLIQLKRTNHYHQEENLLLFASVLQEISGQKLKQAVIDFSANADAWNWGNANAEEKYRAIILFEWKMPQPTHIKASAKYDMCTIPTEIYAIERRMRWCTNSVYPY